MTDKSPAELQAEVERLSRDLQSAHDRLKNRGPAPREVHDLAVENAALKAELVRKTNAIAAEHGPDAGAEICYQAPGESFCRPGKVVSDGFTHRQPLPGGESVNYCHLEYGEPPWAKVLDGEGSQVHQPHTWETERAWNPAGLPGTWHLMDECPKQGGKGCPFGDKAAQACADRAAQFHQAP